MFAGALMRGWTGLLLVSRACAPLQCLFPYLLVCVLAPVFLFGRLVLFGLVVSFVLVGVLVAFVPCCVVCYRCCLFLFFVHTKLATILN